MNRHVSFSRAPTATPERRAAMEDALSWALPPEARPHVDLHVVAGDLINLLYERGLRFIEDASESGQPPKVHRDE